MPAQLFTNHWRPFDQDQTFLRRNGFSVNVKYRTLLQIRCENKKCKSFKSVQRNVQNLI